jgi:hypothetical protein
MYVDQNMQYAHYLAPPPVYPTTSPTDESMTDQADPASPGKLDVRMSGHARAVSLPASVVMQSTGSQSAEQQANGNYDVEQQRMYGLGLENAQ